MKKGLLVLAVLLVVGAMAFADDMAKPVVSLTGEFDGGVLLTNTSSGQTWQLYNNNEGTPMYALLHPTVTVGDFAADSEFYFDGSTLAVNDAWVTEKLMNDMVELRAGIIDNGLSGTIEEGWGGISTTGLQVVVNPISGLSVGLALPASVAGGDFSTQLQNFAIGATYTMAKLATIDLTYGYGTTDGLDATEFAAGVSILAVPNLSAFLEAQVPTASGSTDKVYEEADYALGSLTVGINATQSIASGSFSTTIDPNVSYSLGVPSVGASFTYNTADSSYNPEVWAKATFNSNAWAQLTLDYYSTSTEKVNLEFVQTF